MAEISQVIRNGAVRTCCLDDGNRQVVESDEKHLHTRCMTCGRNHYKVFGAAAVTGKASQQHLAQNTAAADKPIATVRIDPGAQKAE